MDQLASDQFLLKVLFGYSRNINMYPTTIMHEIYSLVLNLGAFMVLRKSI